MALTKNVTKKITKIISGFVLTSHMTLSAQNTVTASAVTIPEECQETIKTEGHCYVTRAGVFTGPFELDLYYLVPNTQNLQDKVDRYFDFENWQKYVDRSQTTSLKVKFSAKLADGIRSDGTRVVLNYFETEAEAPPIIGGKVLSTGVVTYQSVPKPAGDPSVMYKFELIKTPNAQITLPGGRGTYEGPKGLKEQVGSIEFTPSCSACEEGQSLMVYKVKMESNPSLMPKLGASYARKTLSALFNALYAE